MKAILTILTVAVLSGASEVVASILVSSGASDTISGAQKFAESAQLLLAVDKSSLNRFELSEKIDPDMFDGARHQVKFASKSDPVKMNYSAKSPKKAFLFSLLVPGLGELYSGAKKRGIAFLGIEIASWISYGIFRDRGNDIEKEFRAFADQNWGRERYLEWLSSGSTRGDTTHVLPSKEEDIQQYYELIGKYDQFVYGWEDRSKGPNSDGSFDRTYTVTSVIREQYEDRRDDSNRNLKRASFSTGAVLFNHVVSAVDAALHAKSLKGNALLERKTKFKARMENRDGRDVLMVYLSRRF